MAIERDITDADMFFLGEDKILDAQIFEDDEVTPQNILGWVIHFLLKKRASDDDSAALIAKDTTTGGIVITDGVNGLLEITFLDTDTDGVSALSATIKAGVAYPYSIKRLENGVETILTFGTLTFRLASQRKA